MVAAARQREIRFTETCAAEIERHPEHRAAIIELIRRVIEAPEAFPIAILRRRAEHGSPSLVLYYSVSPVDGSILFETFIGPRTVLE